jgi:amino acid transporter
MAVAAFPSPELQAEVGLVDDCADVSRASDDEACDSSSSIPVGKYGRGVTWWRLAMIAFIFTCSGPGGLEQVVIAGGPMPALIGIFLVPVLYVIPQIFIVSELGSMMPTSAGNVVWVHRGLGRFAGFYSAWIGALTNMIDVGTYPVLVSDYIVNTYRPDATFGELMGYRLGVFGLSICVSLLSTKSISTLTTGATLFVLAFIVIAFFASTPNIRPAQWSGVNHDIDFSLLGSSLLWFFTGWNCLGSLAGETTNNRVLIQGMSSALCLDVLVYLMALLAALTVVAPDEWDDGYFVIAFDRVVHGIGPYFGASMIIAAIGTSVLAVVCYSRALWGMAELGWAPKVFTRQLSSGAPHIAIIPHAIVGFALMWTDFSFIVQVEYTVSATSYILADLSFLRLRWTEPNAERPFHAPGGKPLAVIMVVVKGLVMGGNMIAGLVADWRLVIVTAATNVAVVVAYIIFARCQSSAIGNPRKGTNNDDGDSQCMESLEVLCPDTSTTTVPLVRAEMLPTASGAKA